MSNDAALLSIVEARVVGVLVEKQRTVPDIYPMTVNAIVAGCNQKTSRDPILELSDGDVQSALDALKSRSFVIESSGSRVLRYAHNVERVLGVPTQSVALLAVLMLRGPQTAGELRINCDRLHRFADISAVEGFLHELAARPSGALVQELPRAPGMRETRWMQLLTGEPIAAVPVASFDDGNDVRQAIDALRADVDALKTAVAELRAKLADV